MRPVLHLRHLMSTIWADQGSALRFILAFLLDTGIKVGNINCSN